MQEGAQGYLIKGQIQIRGLLRAIQHAIERKVMEEALFEEKERAQVTLTCIADAVACTDVSGHVTFLNRVAETMTAGRPRTRQAGPWARPSGPGRHERESIANPMEMAVGRNRTVHLPSNCLLIRRDASRFPSKAPSPPSTTVKGGPSARSWCSAT